MGRQQSRPHRAKPGHSGDGLADPHPLVRSRVHLCLPNCGWHRLTATRVVDDAGVGMARLADGHRRPESKTLSHWYGALGSSLPQATETSLQSALRSADALLYGCGKPTAVVAPTQELLTACAVVEQRVGTKYFRQAFAKVKAGTRR